MSGDRLLDVQPTKRRRWTGSTALALLERSAEECLRCRAPIETHRFEEAALFIHGGYGATRRTTYVRCTDPKCPWSMIRDITEVNPRR